MQLETVIKLVKGNKNCFGYIKADKLIKGLQDNLKSYELIIAIRRITDKEIDTDNIIEQVVLPICKSKQVLLKVNNHEVHLFTRSVLKLHKLHKALLEVNKTLGKVEGFEILTNYDLIREDIRKQNLN